MCCDGWDYEKSDGTCPECGEPTTEGEATRGCNWSPVTCETCGARPCDNSC